MVEVDQNVEDIMRHGATITVGYDGSPTAARALRWALDAGSGRDASVDVIACYGPPPYADPWFGYVPADLSMMQADAERRMVDALAAVAPGSPDVIVHHRTTFGPPAQRLVEEAAHSDLLVIGTKGHRGFDAWRLGSVADAVVRHAPCPVVLVPDVEPAARRDRIVVGVDGSPSSTAALLWACDEADDRDAELHVVHAWDYPYATELGSPTARDMTRVDAGLELEASARMARDRRRGPVEDILVEGGPATELAARSRRADLVVVGNRGRSQVRAALFGSVSQALTARAACPTVIVRSELRGPGSPGPSTNDPGTP
jgi:nucleotide-binding universal stress UspA family protein